MYKAEPCPCGHKACKHWHVSPVALVQGVSFTRLQAEAVAALLNRMEERRWNVAKDALHRFFEGKSRNAWLEIGPLKAYMRKSRRPDPNVEGELVPFLELANVSIAKSPGEPTEHTGLFRQLVEAMEAQSRFDWLYIENVHTKRLHEILLRHGWTRIPLGLDGVASYRRRLR